MSKPRKQTLSLAIYQTLLEAYVRPCLEPYGFKARASGERFELKEGDCICDLAGIYTSRRGPDCALMDVAVGIKFRSLSKFLSQCRFPHGRDLEHCSNIGGHLDNLTPPPRQCGWNYLEPGMDVEQLGAELVGKIRRYAFPFWEEMSRIENAMDFWEDRRDRPFWNVDHRYALAATCFLRGQKDKAYAIAEAIRQQSVEESRRRGYFGDEPHEADFFIAFLKSQEPSSGGA